jgi:putative alpha-1,2-mannosidase
MKNFLRTFILGSIFCSVSILAQTKYDPVDYVSILVGTQSEFAISNGNTYPAVARPWGMNFWTPQTRKMGDGWQYVYTDGKINGLSRHISQAHGSTIMVSLPSCPSPESPNSINKSVPVGIRIKPKKQRRITIVPIWLTTI